MTFLLSQELVEKAVYNPSKPWEDNVLKIIGLSDLMKKLDPQRVFDALERIKAYEDDLRQRAVREGRGDDPVSQEEKARLVKLLDEHVSYAFDPDEFTKVADAVYLFYPKVDRNELKLGDLWNQFAAFRMIVQMELFSRLLLVLDPQRAPFYGRGHSFGVGVEISFPSASYDIAEAGNCYALGRNTACVMHLMRVLEKGLRALAAEVGLPFKTEAWGRVIGQIEDKLTELRQPNNKSPKKANLHFYSECAVEFANFKDAWRNCAAHESTQFDEHEARSIMEHVKAFMQKVSVRLSE
jgi:hypothetical protein